MSLIQVELSSENVWLYISFSKSPCFSVFYALRLYMTVYSGKIPEMPPAKGLLTNRIHKKCKKCIVMHKNFVIDIRNSCILCLVYAFWDL